MMTKTKPAFAATKVAHFDGTVMVADVHVFMGGEQADRDADIKRIEKKALAAGHDVVKGDGTRTWRDRRVLIDTAEGLTASERFTWHEDLERVKCALYELTRTPDGEVTERLLRHVWVSFDNAL